MDSFALHKKTVSLILLRKKQLSERLFNLSHVSVRLRDQQVGTATVVELFHVSTNIHGLIPTGATHCKNIHLQDTVRCPG